MRVSNLNYRKMYNKKIAMRTYQKQSSLKPILSEIYKAITTLLVALFKLASFILTFLIFLLIKLAQIISKLLSVLCRYIFLATRRLWQIRELRGFLAGVLVTLAAVVFVLTQFHQTASSVYKTTTETEPEVSTMSATPTPVEVQSLPEIKLERDWGGVDFVNLSYQGKRDIIQERLQFLGVSDAEIGVYLEIATHESCKDRADSPDCMNPQKEPPFYVKHCQGVNGWYAVELANGGQAYCNAGDTEGRNEKSFGIFQILESTWERTGCSDDRFSWYAQVDCAVTLKTNSPRGFSEWSTYSLISQ